LRILVAGATGTLGSQVVRELVGRGHEVVGMTRSDSKRTSLENLGAEGVVADALDARAVERAVGQAAPQGVVSLLTSLPRTGPRRLKDLEPTNRLRDEGTRNLLAAAITAGARRFVGESIIAIYGYGNRSKPATEDDPPGREGNAGLRRVVEAIVAGERHVREATEAGRIEGVSLRFGFYHGAAAPSTHYLLRMVRRRMLPIIGGGHAVHSWIELEDAARAVADALERGQPGAAYNVVDDEPVEFRDYLAEIVRIAQAKPPLSIPFALARPAMPYAAMFLSRARIPASNAKLKRELGWWPRSPTYREALAPLGDDVR
jgi:nucleoside-diphosphate-sugar epimerase